MGVWGGGILLFTVWAGSGGERRGHTGTRTATYTRMLHLPFSDLILKKLRDGETTAKIKIAVLRGGGGDIGGREENRPKRCFSWETSRQ